MGYLVLKGVLECLGVGKLKFDDLDIRREWKHIDILLVFKNKGKDEFVICIENKVEAKEGDDQLNRYFDVVTTEYPEPCKKIFGYLTPNGDTPSSGEWKILSYVDLLKIIEASKEKKSSLPLDVKIFIEHYIETVRSIIMRKKELVKKCNEIYAKHGKALDFIYKNMSGTSQLISILFEELCKEKAEAKLINFNSAENTRLVSNTFVRFTTDEMTKILPDFTDKPDSGWSTKNIYFYEIIFKDNKIKLVFNLGIGKNPSDEQRNNCNALITIVTDRTLKNNWECIKLEEWEIYENYSYFDFEMIKGEIKDKFEKAFNELLAFQEETIKNFNQS